MQAPTENRLGEWAAWVNIILLLLLLVFRGRGKLFLSHKSTYYPWLSFKSDPKARLSLNLTILIKIRLYLGFCFLAAMLVYQSGIHQHDASVLIKQVIDILISL